MELKGSNRRREPRFEIGAPAKLQREGSSEVFSAITINVSTSGVLLQMTSPCDFKAGEKLICEIALPDDVDKTFASWGFGRVIRVDQSQTAIELTAGVFNCSEDVVTTGATRQS